MVNKERPSLSLSASHDRDSREDEEAPFLPNHVTHRTPLSKRQPWLFYLGLVVVDVLAILYLYAWPGSTSSQCNCRAGQGVIQGTPKRSQPSNQISVLKKLWNSTGARSCYGVGTEDLPPHTLRLCWTTKQGARRCLG